MECAVTAANCANCGAPLVGPYCAQCGQHARESSRAMGVLFHDGWHVLTHLDGRFWQTLRTLLFKPGWLTREYFAEHRASYIPPVRLYLVVSVILFALASFGSHELILSESTKNLPTTRADAEQLRRGLRDAAAQARSVGVPVASGEDDTAIGWNNIHCELGHSELKWVEKAVQESCRHIVADHGKSFVNGVIASVPKVLFLFLPFMALIMTLLYWWPRRYYVEHIVFFLHTHAAMFLVMIATWLVSQLAHWQPWLSSTSSWLDFGASLYLAWYVYKAMRVYYGQGRLLTLAKLGVLAFSYLLFGTLTFTATLLAVALYA
jgi:hypothetical protein